MLSRVRSGIIESTAYFANWARLQMLVENTPFEVALVGEMCMDLNRKLNAYFLPNTIITGSKHKSNLPLLQHKLIENQTSIYICKDKVCSLPLTDLTKAMRLIGYLPYSHIAFATMNKKRKQNSEESIY